MIHPENINALKGKSITYVNLGEYEKAVLLDEQIEKLQNSSSHPNQNPNPQNNEKIPAWIKSVFGWYKEDKISENEVIAAIKFLIEKKIIILQ